MRISVKQNLRALGFDKQLENVENGQCALCGSKKVQRKDFRDELSWKEFQISNMCQICMDEIFGEE
jgi:hypothetical protein